MENREKTLGVYASPKKNRQIVSTICLLKTWRILSSFLTISVKFVSLWRFRNKSCGIGLLDSSQRYLLTTDRHHNNWIPKFPWARASTCNGPWHPASYGVRTTWPCSSVGDVVSDNAAAADKPSSSKHCRAPCSTHAGARVASWWNRYIYCTHKIDPHNIMINALLSRGTTVMGETGIWLGSIFTLIYGMLTLSTNVNISSGWKEITLLCCSEA